MMFSPLHSEDFKRSSSSSNESNACSANQTATTTTTRQEKAKAQQPSLSIQLQKPEPLPPHLLPQKISPGSSVQPPRTLQKSYMTFDHGGGLSAAQRVSMGQSIHYHSQSSVVPRASSSEEMLVSSSSAHDEKKNISRSWPSDFKIVPHHQIRQLRDDQVSASKLQPPRERVNNLLMYLHELHKSEASIRKQFLETKRHAENELNQSLLKLNELQQRVERDREIAHQRLKEKEQRIRELSARLEKAGVLKASDSPHCRSVLPIDGFYPIPEKTSSQRDPRTTNEAQLVDNSSPGVTLESLSPTPQQGQPSATTLHSVQHPATKKGSNQFAILSPRSPNRPLWDPWVSGGTTPMKAIPPVFTVGSTNLYPVVTLAPQADSTAFGDYELKSVLLSPRHACNQLETSKNLLTTQHEEKQLQKSKSLSPLKRHESVSPEPQNSSSASSNDPLVLSPPSVHQQDSKPPEDYIKLVHDKLVSTEFSSRPNSKVWVGAMHSSPEYSRVPQERVLTSERSQKVLANQQNIEAKVAKTSPFRTGNKKTSLISDAESITLLSPLLAQRLRQDISLNASETVPESVANAQLDNRLAAGPYKEFLSQSSPTSKPQLHHSSTTSSPKMCKKVASTEHLSLETMLVDFFTEVDNKRVNMANVYGKRYTGREKWLFAELTKRYGATKVAVLKARFENTRNEVAPTVTTNRHASSSSIISSLLKVERRNHPRYPQFLNLPTLASNGDRPTRTDTPSSSSLTTLQELDALRSQSRQVTDESETTPTLTSLSGQSERKQHSVGNVSPPPGFPTSIQMPQTNGNNSSTTGAVDNDDPRAACEPQKEEPNGRSGLVFSNPQATSMDNRIGLRQCHQPLVYNEKPTTQSPVVTLEELLKELYKNHQPDKLKNVSTIAMQYTGNERELVGLLKGKYGPLSVKRLEEKLDVLECAHRARTSSKDAREQRGCFVRMVSLVFWVSMLVSFFSFGAVLVSFVVSDAWKCHLIHSEEQEYESYPSPALVKDVISNGCNREASISSAAEAEQVIADSMDMLELEEMALTTVDEFESLSGPTYVVSAIAENGAIAIEDACFNDNKEVSDVADEAVEGLKTEVESVVEVEMRLDLSYSDPTTDGVILEMPANVSNVVDNEADRLLSADGDVLAGIKDADFDAVSDKGFVDSQDDINGRSMSGLNEQFLELAQESTEATVDRAGSEVEADVKNVEELESSPEPISEDVIATHGYEALARLDIEDSQKSEKSADFAASSLSERPEVLSPVLSNIDASDGTSSRVYSVAIGDKPDSANDVKWVASAIKDRDETMLDEKVELAEIKVVSAALQFEEEVVEAPSKDRVATSKNVAGASIFMETIAEGFIELDAEDEDKGEEIAFMMELENPEEMLRMADLAATAMIGTRC
ncbi:hypothetical protein PsorP6_001239 [Peronosclerospora sorghi]|uniref:Uncharacterized protein n=1 Tax=Peronosclerospora sorghi TaxID=230839 RepID=A0ACC0WPB1_9STRA|nr:hypothetical protein PsorP6_001239 [Peronosclerospora sorghi]